jgi:hypothetical protein
VIIPAASRLRSMRRSSERSLAACRKAAAWANSSFLSGRPDHPRTREYALHHAVAIVEQMN